VRFALAPGKTFQGEESLGAGVFGSVAQCVLEDGTDVAVKQYKSADSPGAERSFNTMKTLEGNEYIVKTYGFGTIQNKAALAMELAPDGTIQSRIERGDYKGKEKEQKMKEVGSKLLEGFTYMHSKSIAHRDIHNGNVVFKGDTPKVVDFDFACELTQCIKFVPGGNGGQAAPGRLLSCTGLLNALLI
jgi:serine/threonine protein kinase